jgi:hypothetical protein
MKSKMPIRIAVLLVATVILMLGCSAAEDVSVASNVTNQVSPATTVSPSPQTTPEPTMPILKEIAKFKREKPDSTEQEVAAYGNEILPRLGFEYDLDLEEIIKRKIKQRQTKPVKVEGDDFPYVTFGLDLVSTTGVKKKLVVTAPADSVCCCGYYYTSIPVTKITPKELTVVIDSQEVVIKRPKDFPVVQDYIFGKQEAKPTKLRSWEVPYETYPYGVSSDGLKLYIETEIDGLLLEISENGSLKFATNDSEQIVTNGEDINKLPPPKEGEILHKSGEFGLMRYILNDVPYVVEFPYPCT